MKTTHLSPELQQRLWAVSQQLGRPETDLLQEAVLNFLEEFEDAQDAQQRLENPPEHDLTLAEVEQELGLAD
ncbi:MAG: hypothetical protein VKJ27_00210 [Synechocystis sp.]|nr:hypothetical protein [Synechocystis sp.]